MSDCDFPTPSYIILLGFIPAESARCISSMDTTSAPAPKEFIKAITA